MPLDSIAALEYYKKEWQPLLTLTSAPAVFVSSSLLFVAIFGSCPTVYSFDGQNYNLGAETFSYSIAKRFESSDLDRLDFGELQNGEYSLKIANEALETHYINQLCLLSVVHPPGYEAFPMDNNDIVFIVQVNK